MIRQYYLLAKPGIVYGNLFAAIAGFFLAAHGDLSIGLLLVVIVGLSCIIGSACVANNILDRHIDQQMQRTKRRALATGHIVVWHAIIYSIVLFVFGSFLMAYFTTVLAWLAALVGWAGYVIVYGFAKRKTVYATEIGSIPGAMPPVVGYTAVTNSLDITVLFLFLTLVCWQMPHFFSLALFQRKDYLKTGMPIVSTKKTVQYMMKLSKIYIIAFCAGGLLLFFYGDLGIFYLFSFIGICLYWLHVAFQTPQDLWSKRIFKSSLVVLLAWSVSVCLDSLL